MGETANLINRRKQLRYRANHRGIKEMDIIFGQFADRFVDAYNDSELDKFETLMAFNDRDLLQWFTGELPVPEDVYLPLFDQISSFASKRFQSGYSS